MKTISSKLMIAAGALAITAGIASAQAMKADIPFTFRAGSAVMPAGQYRVEVDGARQLLTLTNLDSRNSIMLLAGNDGRASKEWRDKGEAVAAFECGASRCALVRVWTGYESPAFSLLHRSAGGEHAPLTLIRLIGVGR